eukprot:scaffold1066_cov421-Prasinococcus_capsulatus_cf.AAC.11
MNLSHSNIGIEALLFNELLAGGAAARHKCDLCERYVVSAVYSTHAGACRYVPPYRNIKSRVSLE